MFEGHVNEFHNIVAPNTVDYISIRAGTSNHLHPADRGYDIVAVKCDEYDSSYYLTNQFTVGDCRKWCKDNYPKIKIQRD